MWQDLATQAVGVVPNYINGAPGGLSYTSDQATYPRELELIGPHQTEPVERIIAEFYSPGLFVDNTTRFALYGDFSKSNAPPTRQNRVLANVYIDVENYTSYWEGPTGSRLIFNARALQVAKGTPDNPKIHFVCTGRFDPAGLGDCSYRVVLEVNQFGEARVVDKRITSGGGRLSESAVPGQGFTLQV